MSALTAKPGEKYNRWTVLKVLPDAIRLCRCECGTVKPVFRNALRRGMSKSCGCFKADKQLKHGHATPGAHSPTYNVWHGMMQRCFNEKTSGYKYYGGRGIKVCVRWQTFENFLADMGERPEGLSIDRYPNNDGNYEPGNCRWATAKEQNNNSRHNRLVTLNGQTKNLKQWADHLGLKIAFVAQRIIRGWSPERALTERAHNNGRKLKNSQ